MSRAFDGFRPGPNILYTSPPMFDFILPKYFLELSSKVDNDPENVKVDVGLDEVFLEFMMK